MSRSTPPLRFIAGAVCPDCRALDRLVIEAVGDAEQRRCVACGYTDQRPAAAAVEPSTRLSRSGRGRGAASPVRIVDLGDGDGGPRH